MCNLTLIYFYRIQNSVPLNEISSGFIDISLFLIVNYNKWQVNSLVHETKSAKMRRCQWCLMGLLLRSRRGRQGREKEGAKGRRWGRRSDGRWPRAFTATRSPPTCREPVYWLSQTQYIHPVLAQFWAIVVDGGPTLTQQWVLCLLV